MGTDPILFPVRAEETLIRSGRRQPRGSVLARNGMVFIDQRRVRWASLGFAVVLFLYSISRMVMLPVV